MLLPRNSGSQTLTLSQCFRITYYLQCLQRYGSAVKKSYCEYVNVNKQLGILEYDMELKKHIERASVLESGDDEVELRAVAVEACERIVAAMKNHEKFKDEGINALYLDYYLWSVGKDTKFRSVHRHYTQNTIFY